jgi:hypothetical protein
VRDRAQLVVLAYETGLVRPGPRRLDAGERTPPTRRRKLHSMAA